jgi:glycosyltransferase involved in cell wall biosynthesis
VSTRAGGLPEVVADGETGLLVPAHDDAALAQAILTLLRDPARRTAMGEAGYARVQREFSIDKMVADTVRVYERKGTTGSTGTAGTTGSQP